MADKELRDVSPFAEEGVAMPELSNQASTDHVVRNQESSSSAPKVASEPESELLPEPRMIEGLEPPAVCLECGDTYSRFCMFYDDQRPPRQRISPVHHDRYGNFWACLLDNKHQCV